MDKVRPFIIISIPLSLTQRHKYRYIEETLEQDRAKFKAVAVANPFLTDFVAGTSGSAGGDDDGAAARQAGTIGSMHGILGAL